MSCCESTLKTAPLSEHHRIRLRYLGGRSLLVKGPVTGANYQFSGVDRELLVDPRDAVRFAKDRNFQVIGVVDLSVS